MKALWREDEDVVIVVLLSKSSKYFAILCSIAVVVLSIQNIEKVYYIGTR